MSLFGDEPWFQKNFFPLLLEYISFQYLFIKKDQTKIIIERFQGFNKLAVFFFLFYFGHVEGKIVLVPVFGGPVIWYAVEYCSLPYIPDGMNYEIYI